MKSTAAKNVIMEQRADIRVLNAIGQALPTLKKMTENHQNVGGVAVTMLGPFHIQFIDGTKEQEPAIMQIEGCGEQHELMLLRDVKEDLPEIDEAVIKKFEPIFNKLPEPKLESAVRLVAETAHRLDSSVQSVAKALNCSVYKAKSVMAKFGLSS